MKYVIICLCLLGVSCSAAIADMSVRIGTDKDKFQVVLSNPTDSEVVRLQAIQSQQVLLELALKGCNKKSLREKLLGK